MTNRIYCELPRAGLANRVFALYKAFLRADRDYRNLYWCGICKVSLGPFLRRESDKRLYFIFFRRFILLDILMLLKLRLGIKCSFIDSESVSLNVIPTHDDIKQLKCTRDEGFSYFFLQLLNAKLVAQVKNAEVFDIHIHIRRGDFRINGNQLPISYYAEKFKLCVEEHFAGKTLKVRVFTDSFDEEVEQFARSIRAEIRQGGNPVESFLMISRCVFLICTPRSSFPVLSALATSSDARLV